MAKRVWVMVGWLCAGPFAWAEAGLDSAWADWAFASETLGAKFQARVVGPGELGTELADAGAGGSDGAEARLSQAALELPRCSRLAVFGHEIGHLRRGHQGKLDGLWRAGVGALMAAGPRPGRREEWASELFEAKSKLAGEKVRMEAEADEDGFAAAQAAGCSAKAVAEGFPDREEARLRWARFAEPSEGFK